MQTSQILPCQRLCKGPSCVLCCAVLCCALLQVNAAGNVLLDTFVAQKEAVVDFRTWVSGVTPQHLLGAPSLEEVQKQVGGSSCWAGVKYLCGADAMLIRHEGAAIDEL